MHPDAVARRLQSAAQFQAARLGFQFSNESWMFTQGMIATASERLAAEDAIDTEAALAVADSAVTMFVSRMAVEATRLGFAELREDTFYAAQRSVCPLWPIC